MSPGGPPLKWANMARTSARGSAGQAAVSIVGAVALVGASLAALFGAGAPARSVSLRDGAVWVQSILAGRLTGTLTRLDTATGVASYFLPTSKAKAPLEIVNDGINTVLRDPVTGEIFSIDLSGATAKLNGPTQLARGARLVSGAGRTFVVRAEEGDVAALDPVTLVVGDAVSLGGSLSSYAVDGAGTLWVAVPDRGAVVPVSSDDGRVVTPGEPAVAGGTGTKVDVTVSAGTPYGLVAPEGLLLRLQPRRVDKVADVPAGAVVEAAQGDPADGHVVLGFSDTVLRVNPLTGRTIQFDLNRGNNRLGPPVQTRNRIVVPDQTTGDLIVIDPASGKIVTEKVREDAGEIQLTVADGAVVANVAESSAAVVVTPTGEVRPVTKSNGSPGGPGPGGGEGDPSIKDPTPDSGTGSIAPRGAGPPSFNSGTTRGEAAAAPSPGVIPGTASAPPTPSSGGTPGMTPGTALDPPGVPVNLTSAGGTGQVVLSWQASAAGGAPSEFLISGPNGTVPVSREKRTLTISAANGIPANFTIRANNASGPSSEVSFPPATPQSQVPGPPGEPTAVPGDRQITLTWTQAPANGTTIKGYRVVAGNGATTEVDGATTTARLAGLTNGADYAPIAVTAVAAAGGGKDITSQAAMVTDSVVPFGKPLAPTDLDVSAGDGSITVTFPPANNNGAPVSAYELTLNPGGQTRPGALVGGRVEATFNGLSNGTIYTVVATATNQAGTSPLSKPAGGTPRPAPITDNFESGAAGWTIFNSAQGGEHKATGGSPGGYFSATDPVDAQTFFFEAPPRYAGNRESYAGALLRFHLRTSPLMGDVPQPDVWLIGAGKALCFDHPDNPGTSWKLYEVPLNGSGWTHCSVGYPAGLGGTPATLDDMKAVLGDLKYLRIRGEFTKADQADRGDLDNVVFGAR